MVELVSKKGERVTYDRKGGTGKSIVTFYCSAGGYEDRITIANSPGGGLPSMSTPRAEVRHAYIFFQSMKAYRRHSAYVTRENNDLVKFNGNLYLVRLPVARLNVWIPSREQADILLIASKFLMLTTSSGSRIWLTFLQQECTVRGLLDKISKRVPAIRWFGDGVFSLFSFLIYWGGFVMTFSVLLALIL